MTPALLGGIASLAALDALNPATLMAVSLVLLLAPRAVVATALATIGGAAATVFVVGLVLYETVAAASAAVVGVGTVLRYVAFSAAAVALLVAGWRRLRDRPRSPLTLPAWFGPRTAPLLGMVLTGADLPNAFPYFIAIERLAAASVPRGQALAVLAGYTAVYCLPCLVLLGVGRMARARTAHLLRGLQQRLGTGTVPRSVPAACTLAALGLAVAVTPFLLD